MRLSHKKGKETKKDSLNCVEDEIKLVKSRQQQQLKSAWLAVCKKQKRLVVKGGEQLFVS